MAFDIEGYVKRIDGKLSLIIDAQNNPKKTWVKVSVIQELTGWDNKWLRKARDNKIVEYRHSKENGLQYCIESIPLVFIKRDRESVS